MPQINIIKGEAEQTDRPEIKKYNNGIVVETPTAVHITVSSFDKDQSSALANFIKEKLEEFYK